LRAAFAARLTGTTNRYTRMGIIIMRMTITMAYCYYYYYYDERRPSG
jgi:hypothetical protein